MMRIEEEEDKSIWPASSSNSPPGVADAAANAVGKGGKKGKGKTKSGGKERRGQYVRSISQTKGVLKEISVLMLTPERQVNV